MNSSHGENDLVRSDANGSEHTRERCCLSCVLKERTLCESLLVSNRQREWERKERPRERHKPKDGDTKKRGACHNCNEFGHFARECPEKKESNNASSSGGGDVHCLTYTDDLSQWIMMLAEIGQIREQSKNIEFWWILRRHAMRGRAQRNLVLHKEGH